MLTIDKGEKKRKDPKEGKADGPEERKWGREIERMSMGLKERLIKITVLSGARAPSCSPSTSPHSESLKVPLIFNHFTSGLVLGSIPPLLGHLADIRVNSQYGAVFALSDTGTNLGYFLGTLSLLLISLVDCINRS